MAPQALPERKPKAVARKAMLASAWLVTGFAYRRVVQLVIMLVLARLLVPEDFGLVALATTLLLMLTSISELSLFNALIHEREPTRADYDTVFTLSAVRGVILAGVMVVGGLVMAAVYSDPRLFPITAALGIRPLLGGLSSPHYVTLAKKLSFGRVAFQESLAATGQLVVAVAVAWFTGSYWAIVAGLLAASVIGLVSTYWAAPYRPRLSIAAWRNLMSFSAWMSLNQIASVVGSKFDNFLAGGVLGAAVFGAYNVGGNVASLVTQAVVQPLERVLFPSFATIVDDKPRLRAAFQRAQACLLAAGLPLGVGLALVAEPFVYVALGPQWSVAVTVIQFIAPVLALQIVFGPANALAYALGATRTLFVRSMVTLVLRVPLITAGLLLYGLMGLLIARVLFGGILISAVNLYMIRDLIGLGPLEQLRAAWRSFVSAAVMALFVSAVHAMFAPIASFGDAFVMLAVLVVTGAVSYCGMHALLWLATGRPGQGIEAEIATIANRLAGRLALRRQRTPAE